MTNAQGGPDPFSHEEVKAALGRSALARLVDRLRDQLLARSVRAELPRGRLLDGLPLFLVISGLIRAAFQSPDGPGPLRDHPVDAEAPSALVAKPSGHLT